MRTLKVRQRSLEDEDNRLPYDHHHHRPIYLP